MNSADKKKHLYSLIDHYGGLEKIIWTTMDGRKLALGDMATPHVLNAIAWHKRQHVLRESQLQTLEEEAQIIRTDGIRDQPDGYATGEIENAQKDMDTCEFCIFLLEELMSKRNKKNALTKNSRYLKMKKNVDLRARRQWRRT